MSPTSGVAVSEVRVTTSSGSVVVYADAAADAVTARGAAADVDGDRVTIEGGSSKAEVRVPEGMDLVIGTSSGRVEVRGAAGSVAVVTRSGKVVVEAATSVDIRSSSGRIDVESVDGECRIIGGSGRVTVDRCGSAHVTTGSGRIVLRHVHGRAHAHCSSGRIDLTMATASDVDAETVSGRISIAMPAGARVRIDAPTSATIATDAEHDCVVTARSGSGRVVVR
jgi:DUF4097 and DUF4098 domain-containing protein YvlB